MQSKASNPLNNREKSPFFDVNLIANNNKIDVKKGGIFPIVQGIRSSALQYAIEETDTVTRIRGLVAKEIIDEDFAGALIEAFDTLLNLI